MKKIIIVILFLVLTSGTVFAGGGQNTNQVQGEEGSGTTSTGESAQGEASQPRAGR